MKSTTSAMFGFKLCVVSILFVIHGVFLTFVVTVSNNSNIRERYDPNWDSLDKRPLPQWYDDAKIGIFLHWGVYSVPSFGSEWFWYNWKTGNKQYVSFMKQNYPPGFTYQDFARDFTAEFFDANAWAKLFEKSGAKYVVLTSKHHEGFTMWPSKYSFSWNAMDVGPNRDILGELAKAVRNLSLKFGLYHSFFEWYNPLYLSDKSSNFTKDNFLVHKIIPEMVELVQTYRPEVIWSDGDWEASDVYWKSTDFLSWLYNESPVKDTVVVNDRWGKGIGCHHGDFYTCSDRYNPAGQPEVIWSDGDWEASDVYWKSTDFLSWLYNESPVKDTVVVNDRWGKGIGCHHGDFYTCSDRYNPGVLQKHKWENAMTIDKHSWGYRRNANLEDIYTIHELITVLAETVSCGGNLLMNVGPTHDGRIDPIFQDRLVGLGQWLAINGEAIYSSKPWKTQNDSISQVWYTTKDPVVYAIVLDWPQNNTLVLGSVADLFQVGTPVATLLGNKEQLKWTVSKNTVDIIFPDKASVKSDWSWVIKIEPLKKYRLYDYNDIY